MSTLQVIAYNVRFGDAILIAVPDRGADGVEVLRHILLDVGNVLAGAGGVDELFRTVIEDVRDRLNGRPLDLYVMSHEHMDHIQGLPYAAASGIELTVDYAWLPASSEPGYHEHFDQARRQLAIAADEYQRVRQAAESRGLLSVAAVRSFLDNNNPASTASCVEYLRGLASKRTSYVHREFRLRRGRHHPFQEARLDIWAPEHDTSRYYGRLVPAMHRTAKRPLRAPPGVDSKAFRDLMRYLETGLGSSMISIDRAANNTSVVFSIEWRGWRLVFPGDAELASWTTMARERELRPVHLLKVSHHGSHNGTPPDEVLDVILPTNRHDGRPRYALLSTWPDTYGGVPDEHTVDRVAARVDHVVSTRDVASGASVTIDLEG